MLPLSLRPLIKLAPLTTTLPIATASRSRLVNTPRKPGNFVRLTVLSMGPEPLQCRSTVASSPLRKVTVPFTQARLSDRRPL